MKDAITLVRLFIAAMILVPLVWLGSCAMLGVGTAVAVNEIAESELAEKTSKAYSESEIEAHNEAINRESSYSTGYDDYGEPM